VIVFAPIFNADGNERMSRTNRPGQVGPEEGMGIRHNAQDLDLNRDFVKLETPEVRALVRFFTEWDPAIVLDAHTTDDSFHQYLITYDGPRNPAGDATIIATVRDTIFPDLTRGLEKIGGWKSYWYANFADHHTRWMTYPALPRYGIDYMGIRNRIGILCESYDYASYKDRCLASRDFVRATIEYAADNADNLHELLDRARDKTAKAGKEPKDEVAVRNKLVPFGKATVPLRGWVEEKKGERVVATGRPHTYMVEPYIATEATLSVVRPYAYLLPASFTNVAENLRRHGIQVEALHEETDLDVEVYRITKITRDKTPFQRHRLVLAEVDKRADKRHAPAGALVVRTAQPLGDLLVFFLEPQSEDGLVTWNFFDDVLQEGNDFPVLRVPAPRELKTREASPAGTR
jgi:hypothetical protein